MMLLPERPVIAFPEDGTWQFYPHTRAKLELLSKMCLSLLRSYPNEEIYVAFVRDYYLKEQAWMIGATKALTVSTNRRKPTQIYLCRNFRNGYTKIGLSCNPRYRESTLQSEEPDAKVLFAMPGTRKQEKKLHDQFSDKRIRGEWFNLSDDDIRLITEGRNATAIS